MASRPRTSGKTFWVMIIVLVIGAYSVGKDLALRENARDEIRRHSTN